MVEWDHPLECIFVQAPVEVSPFRQTNTYVTYRVGIIFSGSDNSQQFRFSFQDKNGLVQTTGWSLLVDLTNRLDIADNGIDMETIYYKYLENDIFLEYRNTAGPVYMNGSFLTYPQASGPSAALQAVCTSFLSGPQDIAVSMTVPSYNGSRPANYNANVGIGVVGSSIPQFTGSLALFSVTISQLFFATYPNASWVLETYRQNSTTPLTLLRSQSVSQGGTFEIFPTYLLSSLINNNYVFKFRVYNSGVEVASPFQNINITTYLGLALHGARISHSVGKSHALQTVQGSVAGATMTFTSAYDPTGDIIPTDDSSQIEYVELSLLITYTPFDVVPKGITVMYNTEGEFGSFPMVINQTISNQGRIFLKTGGVQQNSTQFRLSWVRNLVNTNFPFYYNVFSQNPDMTVYPSEEFTTSKMNKSLSPLVDLAILNPGQWVTTSDYQTSVTKTRRANPGLMSISLQAKFGQSPPSPPTTTLQSAIELIKEKEIDQGEAIYQGEKRVLGTQLFDEDFDTIMERQKMMDNWLLPNPEENKTFAKPIYSASQKPQFHNPQVIEAVEKLKVELTDFVRANPSWRNAQVGQLFAAYNEKQNAASRVKYPLLSDPEAQKHLISYYDSTDKVVDLFQPGAIYRFAPYFEQLSDAEKSGQGWGSSFFGNFMYQMFGGKKVSQLQREIWMAKQEKSDGQWPKLSRDAFNYYWFGTPYQLYNSTQMDMKQSILQHDLPSVYDKVRSVQPVEDTAFGSFLESLEYQAADPYNQLSLAGLAAVKAMKKLKSAPSQQDATLIALQVQKELAKAGTAQGAAEMIAEFAVGMIIQQIAAKSLEAAATPFVQRSASALDWFLAKLMQSQPAKLSKYDPNVDYSRQQNELAYQNFIKRKQLKGGTAKSIMDSGFTPRSLPGPSQIQAIQAQEKQVLADYIKISSQKPQDYSQSYVPSQTEINAWERYSQGQQEVSQDDTIVRPAFTETNPEVISYKDRLQIQQAIRSGEITNNLELSQVLTALGYDPSTQSITQSDIDIFKPQRTTQTRLNGFTIDKMQTPFENAIVKAVQAESNPGIISYLPSMTSLLKNTEDLFTRLFFFSPPPNDTNMNPNQLQVYKGPPASQNINLSFSIGRSPEVSAVIPSIVQEIKTGKMTPSQLLTIKAYTMPASFRAILDEVITLTGLSKILNSGQIESIITKAQQLKTGSLRKGNAKLAKAYQKVEQVAQEVKDTFKEVKNTTSQSQATSSVKKVVQGVTLSVGALFGAYVAKKGYDYFTSPNEDNISPRVEDPVVVVNPAQADKTILNKLYSQQFMLSVSKLRSRADRATLLNARASTDGQRALHLHALSDLFRLINTKENIANPQARNLIFEAFAHNFKRNAMRYALQKDMKAYFHFKTLASILNPRDNEEEQLKNTVENYFLYDKIYDSRDVLQTKTENRTDAVQDIMLKSNTLHEFIERVIAGPKTNHKRTFNDAFVTMTERPKYDFNQKIELREPRQEIPKKRITKGADLIKYFNEPQKLNRLSFENRQFIKQRLS